MGSKQDFVSGVLGLLHSKHVYSVQRSRDSTSTQQLSYTTGQQGKLALFWLSSIGRKIWRAGLCDLTSRGRPQRSSGLRSSSLHIALDFVLLAIQMSGHYFNHHVPSGVSYPPACAPHFCVKFGTTTPASQAKNHLQKAVQPSSRTSNRGTSSPTPYR